MTLSGCITLSVDFYYIIGMYYIIGSYYIMRCNAVNAQWQVVLQPPALAACSWLNQASFVSAMVSSGFRF